MRVRDATGWGIVIGGVIGAIAYGWIVTAPQTQSSAQSLSWWIVVVTTVIPLIGYLKHEQPIIGQEGGFINGLGSGLGIVLLVASLIAK